MLSLFLIALAGVDGAGEPGLASGTDPSPGRGTIERIEANLAFWRDAEDVGMAGVSGVKGKAWRVRVRNLSCRPDGTRSACSYQMRPCLWPGSDSDKRSWCDRVRRFERGSNFSGADGWIAVDGDGVP